MKTIEQYNFYYYSILIQPPYTQKKPNKPNLSVSLLYTCIMISLFIEQINSLYYVCVKFKHF